MGIIMVRNSQKKGLCILQSPFFCEINSFGILKYTFGYCEIASQ